MPKAIIIVPYMKDNYHKREFSNKEFLGPQYLVSSLRNAGIECEYINAHAYGISNESILERIDRGDYSFIGISSPSQRSYAFARTLVQRIRMNGYRGHVCMGGFFPSMAYENIAKDLPELDTILLGEGETSIIELVKQVFKHREDYAVVEGIAYHSGKELCISKPKRNMDLSRLPFPVRDKHVLGTMSVIGTNKVTEGFFRILAGRGCYGNCSFCSIIQFYQPHHKVYRTVENLLDEIESLIFHYGINHFRFNDEIFYELSPRGQRWVSDFVTAVKDRKINMRFNIELRANDVREREVSALKEVGLERVSIGAESGIQRILDEMNKNCTVQQIRDAIYTLRKCDVESVISFITIIPTMTFEELRENYRFLFELDCYSEENLYNKLNIYCGCAYEQILEKNGLLRRSNCFYERHNYTFKDSRVSVFAQAIEEMRAIMSIVKKNIINLSSNQQIESNHFMDLYKQYVSESRAMWKDIVLVILDAIEDPLFQTNTSERLTKAALTVIEGRYTYLNQAIHNQMA